MRRLGWIAALGLAAMMLPASGVRGDAGQMLVAHDVRTFEVTDGAPLVLPTSVAVTDSGTVWVADGVNDRVVGFTPDGAVAEVVDSIDGRPLSSPGAVETRGEDLWVADTGGRRIAVRGADGAERSIEVAPPWGETLDVTDLAVSSDGRWLWLVDNDHHRVIRGDLDDGTWAALGRLGAGTGRLRYPFTLALADDGDVYVGDALNGRLSVFTAAGRAGRPIGGYGVSAGQLYRPKGIAAQDGLLWVADGTLGVIQAFDRAGPLVDVLREPDGELLRLANPAGLDVVGDRIFVVEMDEGRVRELRFEAAPGLPRTQSRPGRAARGRECTVCHLELVPELERGDERALIPPPPNHEQQPWVSRPENCQSCHDGTIMDSRKRVWAMPGHPRDQEPEEPMVVPDQLPLTDGMVTCRTCHSAHTLAGSGKAHRDALLLRVDDRPSELCVACHGEPFEDQPPGTSHPTGELETADGGLSRVECLDCHGAHGTTDEERLVEDERGDACLDCHEEMRTRAPGEHSRGKKVQEPAADRTLAKRGLLLPEGRVACLSCHKAHGEVDAAALCVTCHGGHQAGSGRVHSSASCLDCHAVHVVRRDRVVQRKPSPGDPTGCLACHGPGTKAEPDLARPGTEGHPLLDQPGGREQTDPPLTGCPSCHDPHGHSAGDASLCERCHDEREAEMDRGGHGDATCIECHPAHNEPVLAHIGDEVNLASRRCLACHAEGSEVEHDTPQVDAYQHPSMVFLPDGTSWTPEGALPLYGSDGRELPAGRNGDLVCSSCHLTHGPSAQREATARRRAGWEGECTPCHGPTALSLYLYFHKPDRREE